MDVFVTSVPPGTAAPAPPPGDIVTKGPSPDNSDFAAVIGGVVSVVVLLLILTIALLLWCLSRHKGSYVTNEMDEEDDVDVDEDEDESVGSDTALQSKEPLKTKEEE
ncbi:small cell adhesion glycoprotein homolog [Xyrichtys novacula]|uniref:Small cell adhesion glycoprotein homolog n=1 Tax=Xyrichtys novacula TaxID=13765 RepID=A0AAV1HMZ8_XYRNO|nr:small cell adhesion glycoprotein homolog [Xyrichtys novacula]